MSFSKSFFAGIESELGHTPLVEVVEPPAQMEGIGDDIAGIGKKVDKAAAIGALAFGAANAANAPGAPCGNLNNISPGCHFRAFLLHLEYG